MAKFLKLSSGQFAEESTIGTSAGSGDAGKVAHLNASGLLDPTLLTSKADALLAFNPQTGTSYTLVLADLNKSIEADNASAIAVTVPTNATLALPVGFVTQVVQVGAGQVTVGGSGITFRAAVGLKTRTQHSPITLTKLATDTWRVSGDAAA